MECSTRNAIFFLAATLPPKSYLDFLSSITTHDIFLVLDSKENVPQLQFPVLQILAQQATSHGYWDWAFADRGNPKGMAINPCSWEKAIYAHSRMRRWRQVWFVETDVFLPSPNIFAQIDENYDGDLLTAQHISIQQDPRWVWWPHIHQHDRLPQPWFHSMVCACRVSSALLEIVHDYAAKYRKLAFGEAMLNTIAHHSGMKVQTPPEMSKIVWREDWKEAADEMMHPVKDFELQERWREELKTRK